MCCCRLRWCRGRHWQFGSMMANADCALCVWRSIFGKDCGFSLVRSGGGVLGHASGLAGWCHSLHSLQSSASGQNSCAGHYQLLHVKFSLEFTKCCGTNFQKGDIAPKLERVSVLIASDRKVTSLSKLKREVRRTGSYGITSSKATGTSITSRKYHQKLARYSLRNGCQCAVRYLD